MIIGHRGARGELPENTLAGIRHAIATGCDMIEIDVRLTRDGVVVVTHDPQLNPDLTRTASGGWLDHGIGVGALTWRSLREYDVGRARPGSDLARRFPDQAPLTAAAIPTLAEVLDVARDTATPLLIELKTDAVADRDAQAATALATAAARDVLAAGLVEQTVFQSFDWRSLRRVRDLIPQATLCGLTCAASDEAPGTVFSGSIWLDGHAGTAVQAGPCAAAVAAGFAFWAPAQEDLTADAVHAARAHGIGVLVWTVNDAARIDALLEQPVDGIITDHPTLAITRRQRATNPPA